jgi:hypothetical protein
MVAVLFKAGAHVPVIAGISFEERGSGVIVPPEQTSGKGLKLGVILILTVTVRVALVAHCPAVGVKV